MDTVLQKVVAGSPPLTVASRGGDLPPEIDPESMLGFWAKRGVETCRRGNTQRRRSSTNSGRRR